MNEMETIFRFVIAGFFIVIAVALVPSFYSSTRKRTSTRLWKPRV